MPVYQLDQRIKRRVSATLVVMLGFQAVCFLVATLAVGRVGALKVWVVMVVFAYRIIINRFGPLVNSLERLFTKVKQSVVENFEKASVSFL